MGWQVGEGAPGSQPTSGFQTRRKPKPSKSLALIVSNSSTPCWIKDKAKRQSYTRRRAKAGVASIGQKASWKATLSGGAPKICQRGCLRNSAQISAA